MDWASGGLSAGGGGKGVLLPLPLKVRYSETVYFIGAPKAIRIVVRRLLEQKPDVMCLNTNKQWPLGKTFVPLNPAAIWKSGTSGPEVTECGAYSHRGGAKIWNLNRPPNLP